MFKMSDSKYRFTDTEEKSHCHEFLKEGTWKPLLGTSTVLDVLSKPLTYWAVGLALAKLGWVKISMKPDEIPPHMRQQAEEMALEFKRAYSGYVSIPREIRLAGLAGKLAEIQGMNVEEFLSLLDEAYVAHKTNLKVTAQGGKDLHALAEAWIKGQISGENIEPDVAIKPLVLWARKNVKRWLWSEMHCYSEKHWVGGISDAGYENNEGVYGILDLKSSKDAYTSQFIQIGGYDVQISENGGFDAEGNKIFELGDKTIGEYIIFPFGMKNPEAQVRYNTAELRKGFLATAYLYRLINP